MSNESKKTTKNGKTVGRPNLPAGERVVFQRIAVWPKTYLRIRKNSKKKGQGIAEYLESEIK